MEINVSNFSDFVKNAEILWIKGALSVPQVARTSGLYKEIQIPNNSGNTREFSEVELEEYAKKKAESEQSSRANVTQGYSKIGTLYRVSKDIGISFEARSQGKYLEMNQKLTNLGKMGPNRLDLDLTHRITFGHETSYDDMDGDTVSLTVGDGFALFYTAHTLKKSTTTFRNILANNPQFSQGSLEAMELMRKNNTYNQFGEKMTIADDIIWCGDNPATINAIQTVIKSRANVDQNNPNVINPYLAKYRHVVLPRLATDAVGGNATTKDKYWGVASSSNSQAYLGVHEEPRMKLPAAEGKNSEEFSTDDFNFGTRGGWMVVVVAAGWIGASKGDGSA